MRGPDLVVLALLMAAPVQAQVALTKAAPAPLGRLYHYLRTNLDGTEPERVIVFHRDAGRIEVVKWKSRCFGAAYVTADVDPVSGEAIRMVGGRLGRDGEQKPFAFLDFEAGADRRTGKLSVRAALPDGEMRLSTMVGSRPWHLFDFDLASLTVALAGRADNRADFSFALPLLMVGANGPSLDDLGRAEARFVGRERRGLRFMVGGPALGTKGGPMWLDARDGHIVDVRWGVPNHSEYKDFRLRLARVEDGGARAWQRERLAQFKNCKSAQES